MTQTELPARERILRAASQRYYTEGIRAVSADRLIADAGVSKATFYRHFPSKADLVVAYLEGQSARERQAIDEQRRRHASDPAAVFGWYARLVGESSCAPGFRGCPFINAAAELSETDHPGRDVVTQHRAWLASQAAELLSEMDIAGADVLAEQLLMLRDGAMIAGYIGKDPSAVCDSLIAAGGAIIGRERAQDRMAN